MDDAVLTYYGGKLDDTLSERRFSWTGDTDGLFAL